MAGNNSDLILLVVVAVIVGIGSLIKWIAKTLSGEEDPDRKRTRREAGGETPKRRPDEMLEDFFRQMQGKKKTAPEPPPGQTAGRQDAAQNLAARPVPVAVPVARPAKAVRRQKVVRKAPAPAPAGGDPYSIEAVAGARATLAKSKKGRVRQAPPTVNSEMAVAVSLAGGKLTHADLVRGVIFHEVLGQPRCLVPYKDPPAFR